jgi:hypothetical protein
MDQQSVDLITNSSDIATFQSTMQGDFSTGFYGVHTVHLSSPSIQTSQEMLTGG